MNAPDLRNALAAFASLDLARWPGLPAHLTLPDLQPLLAFDPDDAQRGDAGDPRRTRLWVPAESTTFGGGLRLWLDDDGHVVLLEGIGPVDGSGEPVVAPDLGEADARLDAVLGPFHVRGGERVHAGRGLALQVAPETGVLVCLLGFTPTDVGTYRRHLHPHREPTRPLARPVNGPMNEPVAR